MSTEETDIIMPRSHLRPERPSHMTKNLSWKTLSEETILKDPWIDLRASACQLPSGMTISPFYVNHLPDFAVIVAVTPKPDRRVILVRQYRHGARKVLLELPAGCVEPGENPAAGAARELLEETGYEAGRMEFMFRLAPNATNCTSYAQCYLAGGSDSGAGRGEAPSAGRRLRAGRPCGGAVPGYGARGLIGHSPISPTAQYAPCHHIFPTKSNGAGSAVRFEGLA